MQLPLPQLPLLCFESSYLLSIHSWDLTIYNRYLSHHPVPFALTTIALENADDRQTMVRSSAAPSYSNHSFTLAIVKYTERKTFKKEEIPPHLLSICNVPM